MIKGYLLVNVSNAILDDNWTIQGESWFIENTENLQKEIETKINKKAHIDLERNEQSKPRFNLGTWLKASLPKDFSDEIKSALLGKEKVIAKYSAGRKRDRAFILTEAIKVENKIYLLHKN